MYGGEAPSCWAIFCNFLEKKAILMPLNHISHIFRAGAYSPRMQGMHCMPSHLAKKENNNLN